MDRRRALGWLAGWTAAVGGVAAAVAVRERVERRTATVVPGRIYRGAWQSPAALRGLIRRTSIRTVVTLTAINRHDRKYAAQQAVVEETGVDWRIVPMRGSTATLDQLTEAVELIADESRQPVFFHCVGGHHRSNLVQAAYRIRRDGWSAEAAWAEVARLPWTRPETQADRRDRALIAAYALRESKRAKVAASR